MNSFTPPTPCASSSTIEALIGQALELEGSPRDIDPRLTRLAVRLAEQILRQGRERESRQEVQAREALSRLLSSEDNQRFSTALTDRVHRSSSSAHTVSLLSEITERAGGGRALPIGDRARLRAARLFGSLVPELTTCALLERLRDEARPYLWDANLEALEKHLLDRHAAAIAVNLNYLGEEVLGEAEADARLGVYEQLVTRADIDAVSIKLSGIDSRLDLLAFDQTVDRLESRVHQILRATKARPLGPPLIYLDMEAYRDLSLTEAVLERLLTSPRHKSARLGLAVQAYLPEAVSLIDRLAALSQARVHAGGVPLRVRLVKGANLQMERVESSAHRWAVPIFSTKAEVDANFKRSLRSLVDHARQGHLLVGVGSHNLFDIAYALLLRARADLGPRLQFEMLEGMAGRVGAVVGEISDGLLVYAPAVLPEDFGSAVSYLVRRLDENTAPDNFLRDAPAMAPGSESFRDQALRFERAAVASWDASPESFRTQDRARAPLSSRRVELRAAFDNAADTDFTRAANRAWISEHLERARAAGSNLRVTPLLIDDLGADKRRVIDGFDPSRPDFHYPVELASRQDVEHAIMTAEEARAAWRRTAPESRAQLLLRVAERLEENRGQLIAAMVLDAGKRIDEADAELSEAVDFANYYARQALELEEGLLPRGVVVVTPPWNFPLAIPLGGVLAALAAGNTVLLKPAPETPWVAFLAARICIDSGVPPGALQFVPCRDEDAGRLLTDSRVQAVILTGATETARHFLTVRPDLCVMAETGGKNAAYLAPVSDREQAIRDIVRSAFGHAGQKCSALSVLVLHREVYEDESFRRHLLEATRNLPVGSAWDPESVVTPLIRPPGGNLKTIIEQGDEHGTWLLRPQQSPVNPRLVSPGILWGIQPQGFAHLTEFFGPILGVLPADDFRQAMEHLNGTSYGLTAGLYSLRESEQEAFVSAAHAGNLYVNRSLTGAVVGRQPFGGRKESCFGPGAKAGGPDYVRQLTTSRQDDLQEHQVLALREESYRKAMLEHFSRVHHGTEVVGEENYFRYTRGPTALVVEPDARAVDVQSALLARRLCRADFPVLIASAPSANQLSLLVAGQGAHALVLPCRALVNKASELGLERLRVVGTANQELLRYAAEAKISVITEPVSRSGRKELALYLQSQSISFSSHRHGNTSLAQLSRIQKALDAWR